MSNRRLAIQLLQAATTRRTVRCYTSLNKPLLQQTKELLPDERLQAMVAELEKPLHRGAASIGDTHNVLLESIDTLKPAKPVLDDQQMNKLIDTLSKSFTVRQLTQYMEAHALPRKGLKKKELIQTIIGRHWGVHTMEENKREAIRRQKDKVRKSFSATRKELFFIIADNGATINKIEKDYDVHVTIDVDTKEYIVEGPSQTIHKAKEAILSHLSIVEENMDLPSALAEDAQLQSEVNKALMDISKVATSYISLENNKLCVSSISQDALDNTKRLLRLMLTELQVTDKKALDASDYTVAHASSQFTVLPFCDTLAMSLYDRKLQWEQLECDKKEEEGEDYTVLEGQTIGSFENIKNLLMKPLEGSDQSHISMEARFGHLLEQNRDKPQIMHKSLQDLATFKNRSLFHNSMPPRSITLPFIPLTTMDGGFHQRSVQLEYVNDSLLFNSSSNEADIKRLTVEFLMQEDGDIQLKQIIGERNRSVVDVLGVYGNVDIRLLAKEYTEYSDTDGNVGELIDRCKLLSYAEMNAPKTFQWLKDTMVLSDVSFINKKRFVSHQGGLISLNYVKQQDKKVKRTELMLTSVDPQTLDISNAVTRWPSFSTLCSKIAHKWDYSRY